MIQRLKDFSEVGKNSFALLRDALLFLLLLLLVGCPAAVNKRLSDAGIKQWEGLGVKWERLEDAKNLGVRTLNNVDEVKKSNEALVADLDALTNDDPALKARLAPIRGKLATSIDTLAKTSSQAASAVADQQKVLAAAPQAMALKGWVAGNFLEGGELEPGAILRVKNLRPLNVRKGPNESFPTVGVLPRETEVQVIGAPARARGWVEVSTL